MSLSAGLCYIIFCMGGSKAKCSFNHKSNLYTGMYNIEDTKLFNPRFNQPLHSSACLSMHNNYSLAIFPHIGKFVWQIAIMIKIQCKDTACKPNQYMQ